MSDEMDSVARRTAAKTFYNASHGRKGERTVLKLVANSIGRHPILRAWIKRKLKTCNLESFGYSVLHLVTAYMEEAGYPDLGLDRQIKILGETQTVNSRAVTHKLVRSVVDCQVRDAKLQDIPGNTLHLLLLAQETLSARQFCEVILEELNRRYVYRYNRHFWDRLESEYPRGEALKIIRAGFGAQERCFETGVYRSVCRCGMCERQEDST